MDTEKLINDLSRGLKPVKPLSSSRARAERFLLVALALVSIPFFWIGGFRPDIHDKLLTPSFVIETAVMALTAGLATFIAFRLNAPETRMPQWARLGLSSCFFLLLTLAFWHLIHTSRTALNHEHEVFGLIHGCVINLALLVFMPAGFLFLSLKKGAPSSALGSAFAVALALSFMGLWAMRLHCPAEDDSHLLLWHIIPSFLLILLVLPLGRFLFRW